jgi:hypothetical protein
VSVLLSVANREDTTSPDDIDISSPSSRRESSLNEEASPYMELREAAYRLCKFLRLCLSEAASNNLEIYV